MPRTWSLASAAAPAGSPRREQSAARAVALLRQAVRKGYKDFAHLKADSDLDPLRARADYRQLLADLEVKAPPWPY